MERTSEGDRPAKKQKNTGARRCALSRRAHTGRGVGIQWRLLGYLSLFVAFALLLLWIFQIRLLVPFYEEIKNRELAATADQLSQVLTDAADGEDISETALQDAAWRCAEEYDVCITVWRVESGVARFVTEADISEDCIIHNIAAERRFTELYLLAKKKGGQYSCRVKLYRGGIFWVDDDGNFYPSPEPPSTNTEDSKTLIPDTQDDEEPLADNDDFSALMMRLVRGADGKEYIILLDAELTPLSATVTTLQTQFYAIAILLLLGALLLAYLMSRRISAPLVRMNETAKTLAAGEYDVHFVGHGYRETRELAATLNYAAEELSKTDRLQKELIANISHDLRTPLTMITGYGEVMRDLPGENTPDNVQVIIDEAQRLSDLVNDLLDLSRLQAGTRLPEWECLDLTDTVKTVLHRYETLTRHDGYTVSFQGEGPVLVRADRTMLLQVVYNLINNAINYCGEDRRVEVEQTVSGSAVRISVKDNGVGIEPEQLPYIWDRYYKVDRVHRRAMIGTGLGLSIVKGVLEAHGARYGVNSTPGQGSEFWFELDRLTPENEVEQSTEEEI